MRRYSCSLMGNKLVIGLTGDNRGETVNGAYQLPTSTVLMGQAIPVTSDMTFVYRSSARACSNRPWVPTSFLCTTYRPWCRFFFFFVSIQLAL